MFLSLFLLLNYVVLHYVFVFVFSSDVYASDYIFICSDHFTFTEFSHYVFLTSLFFFSLYFNFLLMTKVGLDVVFIYRL